MTFIEFFDKTYIENICVSLLHVPDRIILVGSDTNILSKHITRYDLLFKERGYNVLFEKRGVNKNNLLSIVEVLESIVNTYEDCHFDLTGGDELYLTAMGIVFERHKDKKINMHKYSLVANKLIDCDGDGKTVLYEGLPFISVKENINLYGGEILRAELSGAETSVFSDETRTDIDILWEICKKDPRGWNYNIGSIERLVSASPDDGDELIFSVLSDQFSKENKSGALKGFLKKLAAKGLIEFTLDEKRVTIRYKNWYIKNCLERSGKILEFKIYLLSHSVNDENGDPVYKDIMSGVTVDWDGVISRDIPNTENEIDLILMHGVIPVFISCKNGQTDVSELYKLNTVAHTFGGRYAKKYLIAGSADNLSRAVKHRALDMGIGIISNVHTLSDKVLSEKISILWK